MKKLSKILLSVAAASAVAATMAISAMAEGEAKSTSSCVSEFFTATYGDDGTVTLTGVAPTGDSQTLLVLKGENVVAQENIAQIDQKDNLNNLSSFTSFVLPDVDTVLPDGTEEAVYYIRIGGSDGTLKTGTLTITKSASAPEIVTIVIGDCDAKLNGKIQLNDAKFAAIKAANKTGNAGLAGTERTKADGTKYVIGDCDTKLNGKVQLNDAKFIAIKAANKTGNAGLAGTTIEVLKED